MAIASTAGILALSLVAVYLVSRLLRSNSSERPLPPGPKGLPLLGNVNDLPKPGGELECHHWLKHRDLYGSISSVTVLGQTFIIINDAKIALQLLRDRSAIHSARPHMVFSSDMIGWKNTLAFSGYTDTFKIHRKNIAKVAGSTVSLTVFDRVQEEESVHFLLNLLDTPENLFDHIKKEAGAVILKITYGYTAEAHGNDHLVDMAGKTMHEFAESTVPGKWAVDIMPFLRYAPEWLPGTGFKNIARQMELQLRQTTEQPYNFVKQQMREKKNKVSFLSQAIDNLGSDPEMENIHKWSASSMYLGGADTTVSSLMTFFLAMTVYPEVQEAARRELDSVVGDRLPTSADRERLPYIQALVSETHRWHPVAPMALPHASTKEDIVGGYRIPKGSLLMANNWWFTHDPAVYPDPMIFRPERFMGPEPQPDPRNWIFGYGRRVCPGRYVADNALFITIAQTLAVYKIQKAVDGNGKTIEPELKFEAGVVSHPIPYRTSITPRSEKHAQIIRLAEKEYPWEKSDAETLKAMKW
ncbi:cytochrome P450 [Lophiotrema nucula]|uniref:Cytochrome P450 n=1 Tax=Lophiotrema nucula TaxID=690887 RepID=A0A6A5ZD50_9PLEO|nr:cytochrome P450 [Lophiotrema nucula]